MRAIFVIHIQLGIALLIFPPVLTDRRDQRIDFLRHLPVRRQLLLLRLYLRKRANLRSLYGFLSVNKYLKNIHIAFDYTLLYGNCK